MTDRTKADSCDGKVRYLTYGLADDVARRARRSGKGTIQAYGCAYCRGFHVGTGFKERPKQRGER